MPELVLPQKKYLSSVREAIAEYKAEPSEFEVHAVSKMVAAADNDFAEYFTTTENDRLGIGLAPGRVAHTVFWLVEGDKYIGTFDLRHELTPELEQVGGHIAYQIRPSEQRKGYVTAGLKLCLQKAAEMGLDKVLVTCKEKNVGSYAVMHKVMLEYSGCEVAPTFKNGVQKRRVWIYTQKRWGKIRAVAIAVIKKANKVLAMACHDPVKKEKFYRLPGGGIEFGETAAETLQREIKEEIGVEISVGKKLGVYENIFTFGNQKGHEIMILFEAALPPEYMQKDRIPMLEEEFAGRCYEFVEITAYRRIYPAIFGDKEWQQFI